MISLCIGLCAVGCRGGTGVIEQLDESTGLTILSESRPLVFARAETRYSISGRDYIYLGPVETNRQGTRAYFLWVGMATTLDRGYLAPPAEIPDTLYIETQDEIFDFKLHPWSTQSPGLGDGPLYHTTVAVQTELAARTTLNQLVVLTAGQATSIRISDGLGNTREYYRWASEQDWSAFLERARTTAGP